MRSLHWSHDRDKEDGHDRDKEEHRDIDEAAHGTKKKKMKELGRPVQLFKVATTALHMRY